MIAPTIAAACDSEPSDVQGHPFPKSTEPAVQEKPAATLSSLEAAAAGAALGIGLWVAVTIIVVPLVFGTAPQWFAAGMRAAFPALIGWIFIGCFFGLALRAFGSSIRATLASLKGAPKVQPDPVRIVILGGGFAGTATAKCLERIYAYDPSVAITLVSDTNALLFTPMLAEVAGSSLEPSHINSPTRTSLHRTAFVRARVTGVDLKRRIVEAGSNELSYDHLVLALGSVSQHLGLENVARYSFDFRTLFDATRIRNRVIEMFERAERIETRRERRHLLAFVIAGGGFAGVELAGAVNDFARGIVVDYPRLGEDEVAVVLVHPRDRILPELSASLAHYALERMSARGVTFRLDRRVEDATPTSVRLDDGETIETATFLWTAGSAPNPLLRTVGVPCDGRGAAIVEKTLAVKNHANVWAVGDCAAITDSRSGVRCPPTAQFAVREAATLASNIRAAIDGATPAEFHFQSLGALCVVGHQIACAELKLPFTTEAVRFSGFLAWLLWRGIYLSKLPGSERKLRVLIDWSIELFFPRDIVQTIDLRP